MEFELVLPWSISRVLLTITAALTLYSSSLIIYRLFIHPLRKIPGPWYVAATSWYEFYQDVVLGGNYVKEYPRLHARYGEPNFYPIETKLAAENLTRTCCQSEPRSDSRE